MTTQDDFTAQAAQAAALAAVVARMRKLQAMRDDEGASEAERELAGAHFQRLKLANNVTTAMLEAADGSASGAAKRAKTVVEGVGRYEWQVNLMQSVATANYCAVTTLYREAPNKNGWGSRRVKAGFALFGREENVVATEVLFDYLRQTTERLARDYVGGDRHRMLSREATSYKEGCGGRLANRVLSRHREGVAAEAAKHAAPSDGRAVALVVEDWAEAERCANEDFRLGLPQGTTARRTWLSKLESRAWRAGAKALEALELRDVTDATLLTQVVRAAVEAEVGAAGLEGKELDRLLDYAVTYPVRDHITDAERRANPKKAPKEPTYRAWRGGRARKERERDWSAQSAGRRAADDVSLDKQLADKPKSAGLLKGDR